MIGSELGYAGSEHVANSNVANSTSSETGVNPAYCNVVESLNMTFVHREWDREKDA